ncbi:hypothetical protein SAY86_004687 [Trapa natans]|uniref:Epidermal patterning factor-like protein n=1 Tax=Trapa natans TaxID=22666 RepID=A0AAN7MEX3_TRANT|nr:hypothetical protein SAY86_004687 [Trapa natans]
MGGSQNCSDQCRSRDLIIPMLLLLGSKLFHVEGREVLGVTIQAVGAELQRTEGGIVEESVERTMRRWLIGSSPPRCERRCSSWCRRCEAVQVPVQPQGTVGSSRLSANSRGREDISNYKPMAWKCKCGELLFNP